MANLKLKLNVPMMGRKAGDTVTVLKAKRSGLPVDVFWRKRLKDSAHDGCVEIVDANAEDTSVQKLDEAKAKKQKAKAKSKSNKGEEK